MNIVTISAGLSNPSSSRLLADRLTHAVGKASGAQLQTIELRELAHALADNMVVGFASDALVEVIEQVRAADALIVVTPVFSASYSGLFKSFFDVLEPGLLEGKPVLLAATAGTARHSLVLEHALRPLFSYLKAVPVPTAVFAATEDFGDTRAGALQARIDRAAAELAAMVLGPVGRAVGAGSGAPLPVSGSNGSRRQSVQFDDTASDFVDFESLLEG